MESLIGTQVILAKDEAFTQAAETELAVVEDGMMRGVERSRHAIGACAAAAALGGFVMPVWLK
ncbi:hypothetical protein [Candidatus Poriferisodalis sp.]|uniref:hypothetical protein n=1 Tax=Candidatus Poriferisodalis sp. TaxID=3101277 RepID=UPI003C6F6250